MKAVVVMAVALAMSVGVSAYAGDEPGRVVEGMPERQPIPPADVTIKVDAPAGVNEQDVAHAIAQENAKRDPAAQHEAQVAKQKEAADEAHAARVGKICDSIPEESMKNDPSLRKLCQ